MSVFSSIDAHSRRGYYTLQILLGAGALALASSLVIRYGSHTMTSIVAACFVANVLAVALLMHLRLAMRARLERASLDEQEVMRMVRTDSLTGATMRGPFLNELRDALGRPLAPRHATLVLVDLDHFKQLNDSFGHPFGDAVLIHLVRSIRTLFPDGLVGRLGGDEFAILLRDCDVPSTRVRCQHLVERLRAGIVYENQIVPLSASIGAALSPMHATRSKEMMLLADLALYESKSNGRGRLTVFDNGLLSDKRHRRLVERELRAAIYLNELELHYQPVVNSDGSVYAVEGLVRWRHSVRGLISPGEFVPIAEESGLIDTLGAWVFRRACQDIDSFPGSRISINVSGEQLKRDEFTAMLARVLRETGQSADRFVLEITETAATAATPDVLRRIEAARAMGFRIALDDFGTGFCGFNYLKSLPIDAIKIDRSYIQSLEDDEVARVFVSALTQIAAIQNLTIVAEGVETEAHITLAKAAGCGRFQGYYIARPAPKGQLRHFFHQEPVPQRALAS